MLILLASASFYCSLIKKIVNLDDILTIKPISKNRSYKIMYEINLCSPIYDATQNGATNLRATRILFGIDLLLLCLMYNFASFFLKRGINQLRLEDKDSNQLRIEQLELQFKKWEQQFLLSFGDHAVSVGFVMCFSPFQFELLLSFVFVALKIVNQIKLHKFNSETQSFKSIFRLINLSLLICAMIGLSRMSFTSDGQCDDSIYRNS